MADAASFAIPSCVENMEMAIHPTTASPSSMATVTSDWIL